MQKMFEQAMQNHDGESIDIREQARREQAQAGNGQASPVQATPNLYIDVVLPGPNGQPQKTIYDLATAYALRDALNGALQAFDQAQAQAQAAAQAQTPPAQDDQSTDDET